MREWVDILRPHQLEVGNAIVATVTNPEVMAINGAPNNLIQSSPNQFYFREILHTKPVKT
jgi:hypothetical protein